MAFFSIIIPTYNRAGFIVDTLRSVLAQDFADLEILVVDDGSTDNTADMVRPLLTDSRLQYLTKQNGERGAARNYGLVRARGEYALFLDSDDLLRPNHLSTLHHAITTAAERPNFIATKFEFDRGGQLLPSDLAPLPAGKLDYEVFLRGNPLACNICVRRENPRLFQFEEDRQYAAVEDWMFLLQNTQHDVVQLVDAVTLTMNDHDARSMRADNKGLIRRLELALDWLKKNLQLTPGQWRTLRGRVYYLCAIHAHIDGYWAEAMHFARLAAPGLPLPQAASLLLRCAISPGLIRKAKALLGRA